MSAFVSMPTRSILCVKNPELQPPAVHSSEGVRRTQIPAFAVSIRYDVCGGGGKLTRCMFPTLM